VEISNINLGDVFVYFGEQVVTNIATSYIGSLTVKTCYVKDYYNSAYEITVYPRIY